MREKIGLYMYRNDGGNTVIDMLSKKMEDLGVTVISDFDLRESCVINSRVMTKSGVDLSTLNVLYHMNADERDDHQESILQALEISGVKVVNSYQSYRLAKDKFYANHILRKAQVNVPDAILLPKKLNRVILNNIFNEWGSALLKPRCGFSGKGIIKFDSCEQFEDYYYAIHPLYENFYLEKFIQFNDHDYRIELLDDFVIGGYSRKKSHSFKTNVGAGATLISNEISQDQVDIAKRAVSVIGLTASIVDMVISTVNNQLYVLEVNDSMGLFVEACLRNEHRLSADYLQSDYCYDNKKMELLANYLVKIAKGGAICTLS